MTEVSHLLYRAGQCADALLGVALSEHGMTPRHSAVLLTIVANADGCSQTEIIARTAIDRQTVSDIVRRLAERELIARTDCASDQRLYQWQATDQGYAAANELHGVVERVEREFLGCLSVGERRALAAGLLAIIEAVDPPPSAEQARPLRDRASVRAD
ncbi:MAG: MarR family winged helix-turn-helix transcriptional regulator [Hyphomicrobiaceae bacterium]